MIPDHASLKRQPLFTPIWLAAIGAIGAFLAFIVLACAIWVWATADSTTIIIVRLGETYVNAGADPALSPADVSRAEHVSQVFGERSGSEHIDAIYSGATARGSMTAAPLAARLGIQPVVVDEAMGSLARRMLREHAGGRILVVASGASIEPLVVALGGKLSRPAVADPDHDKMYVVSVPRIGRVNVLQMVL